MSTTSEGTSFRLFVVAWLSLPGAIGLSWILLLNTRMNEDTVGSLMVILALTLFALLVYGYIKNKKIFFTWFAYSLIFIGASTIGLWLLSPLFFTLN